MPYEVFLAARRKLMANVIRDALNRLQDANYQPATNAPPTLLSGAEAPLASSLRQLVDADLLPSGTTLVADNAGEARVAQVLSDGRLYAEGETYDSLLELSEALGVTGNPWSAWSAELSDGRLTLSMVREAHASNVPEAVA